MCLDIKGLEVLADIWVMGTQKLCPRVWVVNQSSKLYCQAEVRLSLVGWSLLPQVISGQDG